MTNQPSAAAMTAREDVEAIWRAADPRLIDDLAQAVARGCVAVDTRLPPGGLTAVVKSVLFTLDQRKKSVDTLSAAMTAREDVEWDGRPQNPERDGWHWLQCLVRPEPHRWMAQEQRWECGWGAVDAARYARYRDPCPAPAEASALREKVERLEVALRATRAKAITAGVAVIVRAPDWRERVNEVLDIIDAALARGGEGQQ